MLINQYESKIHVNGVPIIGIINAYLGQIIGYYLAAWVLPGLIVLTTVNCPKYVLFGSIVAVSCSTTWNRWIPLSNLIQLNFNQH